MTDFNNSIIHLGGEDQVTGSCHLLMANGLNIMVDCGLPQGHDSVVSVDHWPVRPSQIHFLFLTHAHIDHVGRVPELVQKGFKGEIITTHATKALLGPMLRDAMAFSDLTDGQARELDQRIDDLSWGFEYGETFDLKNGITFKLLQAGHILGSCFIRFESESPPWSVIFSGDLGARDTPILPDPSPPDACDLLILESTYGDRVHEERNQRVQRLGSILNQALSDKGKVFVPAFALGRTQELIYELDRLASSEAPLKRSDPLTSNFPFPVFIDSPLGLEITKVYSSLSEYWDMEARELLSNMDHPLDFKGLFAVMDHKAHQRLLEVPGPAVIIAGSGMCTGGRILDHFACGLDDPANDVFFVGYQASGTLGRQIMDCGRRGDGVVSLHGNRVSVRAKVHALTGYSAHADQIGLVEWVQSMPEKPKEIKLVHGEPKAQQTLKRILEQKGYRISPPKS